jgi:hypothetical protein
MKPASLANFAAVNPLRINDWKTCSREGQGRLAISEHRRESLPIDSINWRAEKAINASARAEHFSNDPSDPADVEKMQGFGAGVSSRAWGRREGRSHGAWREVIGGLGNVGCVAVVKQGPDGLGQSRLFKETFPIHPAKEIYIYIYLLSLFFFFLFAYFFFFINIFYLKAF